MKHTRSSAVLTIDVAHPPLSSEEAERLLDETLRRATLSGSMRVIRVIHGYGSGGKGGTLKTTVRNWAFRRKAKFALVLTGEEYSPFLPAVEEFLRSTEDVGIGDFNGINEGMTLLFLP